MARIIGSQKFRAKETGKVYVRVYFTWLDDEVDGRACDSCICGVDYFNKLDPDNVKIGYDKVKKTRFIYAPKY